MLGEMSGILFDSQRVMPVAAQKAGFAFEYPNLAASLANLVS
jgi:NAD dependent epimerase/dehydratase family enzyme